MCKDPAFRHAHNIMPDNVGQCLKAMKAVQPGGSGNGYGNGNGNTVNTTANTSVNLDVKGNNNSITIMVSNVFHYVFG